MKRCDTLEDVASYLVKKHPTITKKTPGGGVYGVKKLRTRSGRGIVFEEIHNFRIFDWTVADRTMLIIDTMATGFAFRGNREIQQSARMFLQKLVVVNVYDFAADFMSDGVIDFSYTLNTPEAAAQHSFEWLNKKPGILRAQWVDEQSETAKLLDTLTHGRRITSVVDDGRNIDMDFDF